MRVHDDAAYLPKSRRVTFFLFVLLLTIWGAGWIVSLTEPEPQSYGGFFE